MPTIAGIPGITFTGTTPPEPPILLVIGAEKGGKSAASITLLDWPTPGKIPLIVAFDASGPDSCAQLGYQMHVIKVKDAQGVSLADKAMNVAAHLENSFRNPPKDFPYGSIVIDCASTMIEKFHEQFSESYTNPLQVHGAVLNFSKRFFNKLTAIGVPTIWIAWLREPYEDTKTKKMMEGGAQISGSFKNTLAGRATNIVMLDRERVGVGVPGADAYGYARMFRTRPYRNIALGGRYALPDPMPAHLGMILNTIMQPSAAMQAAQQTQQPQVQQQPRGR